MGKSLRLRTFFEVTSLYSADLRKPSLAPFSGKSSRVPKKKHLDHALCILQTSKMPTTEMKKSPKAF